MCEEVQNEELDVLEAIFGEDCRIERESKYVSIKVRPDCTLHQYATNQDLTLEVRLPDSYPDHDQPFPALRALHLPDETLVWACKELTNQFKPGEVCVFNWVTWLQGQPSLWDLDQNEQISLTKAKNKSKRKDAEATREFPGEIFSGDRYTEKFSVFQAHVAAVHSYNEVLAVRDTLLQRNKIATATHNILAYRISRPPAPGSKSTGMSYDEGFDEDGEAMAGARLVHMLQATNMTNVAVVVSRWFGGILLGPSRFAIINNTARRLLGQTGPWKD